MIGPDEYHEEIDDNAFTNWMARHNLLVAADAAERFEGEALTRSGEIERFRDVARRLYLGTNGAGGLIEQFDGFYGKEYVDLASVEPRTAPMDVLFDRARIQASQVVKQSDVVQLIALLWDELTPEQRRANFLPITSRARRTEARSAPASTRSSRRASASTRRRAATSIRRRASLSTTPWATPRAVSTRPRSAACGKRASSASPAFATPRTIPTSS